MLRRIDGFLLMTGFFTVSACNLALDQAAGTDPTIEALARTAIQQSAEAQARNQAPATETAALTPTITFTPPDTQTPTREKVTIAVSRNTYCRTGPDTIFDLVGIMNVGEKAEAIGRNEPKTYYVIRLPSNLEKTCWLWYEWATVTGNADALPVIASPPTPTWSPKPDFTFHYIGVSHCVAQYFFRFQVENTGNMTWESYRAVSEDLNTSVTMTYIYNEFGNYEGCGTLSSVPALAPGETGYAASITFGNPSGHNVEVTLRFCTEDNLQGTCVTGNATLAIP
jgi:hypothetical protein